MKRGCPYGSHRVVEPKGELPQPAWRVDPSLPIYSNELLIQVERLNLNSASFAQLLMECGPDEKLLADKISTIVEKRGKMHNPVTGTGGMLLGAVGKVGPDHPAYRHVGVGQRVVTLVSLTLTPLAIHTVKKVHLASGQVDADGHAILFESGAFYCLPDDISEQVLLTALDEAGAPAYVHSLASPGSRVLVVGAGGKIGIMCLFAARDCLGTDGELIAIVRSESSRRVLEKIGVADQVVALDATDTVASFRTYQRRAQLADLTVDCVNVPGTELFSVMSTRERGKLYFASLASRYTVAALGAEGMAKDIDLLLYKGYSRGHADYTVALLRKYPALQRYLVERLLEKRARSSAYLQPGPVPLGPKISLPLQPHDFQLENKAVSSLELQGVVLASRLMQALAASAIKVAPYDASILITGETGVGKEVFAELIHKFSRRCNGSLLKVNCAAIPESLLEAELFGYERGAFTGANQAGKIGLFEAARGGTLFLDEIGDMSPALQAKLLRAVQDKEVLRVGGIKAIPIDVRLIAATNKSLKDLMERGEFRRDLYYRLNVVEIRIPPLRERPEDIIPLAKHFLAHFCKLYEVEKSITEPALALLLQYSWPGNVRELENLVQRLVLCTENALIAESDVARYLGTDLAGSQGRRESGSLSLRDAVGDAERILLAQARQAGRSTREIAALLRTSQSTVVRKLRKYGL